MLIDRKTDAWFLKVNEVKADVLENGEIDPSIGEYYEITVTASVDNGTATFHFGEDSDAWDEYHGTSGEVGTEPSTVTAQIPVAIPGSGIGNVQLADSGEAGHTLTWTYAKVSVFRSTGEIITEPDPTATEAKIYHDVASWSDTAGFPYSWYNGVDKAQVQLYAYCEGTNGTWGEFCQAWPTLAANQYIEFVITGDFPGASDSIVNFDSRMFKDTVTKSTDYVVSATDNEIIVRVYGPTTAYGMDPNIGLNFEGEAMTGIGEAPNMHVTVTVYEEGPAPTTAPTTAPTQKPTESTPSASESESTPSATESTPSESVVDPTATGEIVVPGDLNNDGDINMKDVLAIRKFIAGMETEINEAAADLNGDGAVNMKDVLILRKFLAGMYTDVLKAISPNALAMLIQAKPELQAIIAQVM